jgi:hypothetical protein
MGDGKKWQKRVEEDIDGARLNEHTVSISTISMAGFT